MSDLLVPSLEPGLKWEASPATITKWNDEQVAWAAKRLYTDRQLFPADFKSLRIAPDEVVIGPDPGNRFTTQGRNMAALGLTLADSVMRPWSPSASGSGYAGFAVGNSTQADADADTDLVGASKAYKQCDNGFPQVSAATITFTTTYGITEANFLWEEYGLIIAYTSSTQLSAVSATIPGAWKLITRKAPAGLLTKSGGNWTITITVTLS